MQTNATIAAGPPRLDLTAIQRQFELGDLESLVSLYADDAEIDFHGPAARRSLGGPIGLREGLERIVTAGLKHELRLAAVHHSGGYVVDWCRHPDTGKALAWGGLTISRGLITRHSHFVRACRHTSDPDLGGGADVARAAREEGLTHTQRTEEVSK
jgi:hypothetical protein